LQGRGRLRGPGRRRRPGGRAAAQGWGIRCGPEGRFIVVGRGPPPAARGTSGRAGVVVVRKPAWPKRSHGHQAGAKRRSGRVSFLWGALLREERPRDQLRRLYRGGEGGAAGREGPFPQT